jgi:hypothetical protein
LHIGSDIHILYFEKYSIKEEDIGFENVDTRMKTNLVDNEVVPQ